MTGKQKVPKYSLLEYIEKYSANHHPKIPQDHYKRVFYENIDVLVPSVRERFDQHTFLAFEQLESLLLKALQSQDISKEHYL